jgi:hypothetical protein
MSATPYERPCYRRKTNRFASAYMCIILSAERGNEGPLLGTEVRSPPSDTYSTGSSPMGSMILVLRSTAKTMVRC